MEVESSHPGAEEDDDVSPLRNVDTAAASGVAEDDATPEDEAEGAEQPADESEKDPTQVEMDRIEKEKEGMTVAEKLDTAASWKAEGNSQFKKGEIVKACDSYYRAIVYSRELTKNPQYYPKLGHTEEQRKVANELHESTFTNLALVQFKYASEVLAVDDPHRAEVLLEVIKSADAALRINASNVKALFRRGQARMLQAKVASIGDAQELYTTAKGDFAKVMELDPKNRDAHSEMIAAQQELKKIKRAEVAKEKKEFSFASTLSGLGSKEVDVLGDGSVRKRTVLKTGDGGKWFDADWLKPDSPSKCIVYIAVKDVDDGSGQDVKLSFQLGEADMHGGVLVAIKALTLGERAEVIFAASRLTVKSTLTDMLPQLPAGAQQVTWEVELMKLEMWHDLHKDGSQLQRVHNEGYGRFAEQLAECSLHWRVFGADGALMHSSRYTMRVSEDDGLKQVEDEDKAPNVMVMDEGMWAPLATMCRSLRQGGHAELRLRQLPPLPKDLSSPSGSDNAAMQLSTLLRKSKAGEDLRHCLVEVELDRVVLALQGPLDPEWQGISSLVHERLHAENLLARGEEALALRRFERVIAWAEEPTLQNEEVARDEQAEARATVGWILVTRAAPVLDAGTVSSTALAAARKDLAAAESHHQWLCQHRPKHLGCPLLKAELYLVEDDDFENAHKHLLEAQSIAPADPRVQAELKHCKMELRRTEEAASKARVVDLRDKLKRARTDADGSSKVVELLEELSQTAVSWDTVMETRIGVELKSCREAGDDATKRLCDEILAKFKDESKQQRPMWET